MLVSVQTLLQSARSSAKNFAASGRLPNDGSRLYDLTEDRGLLHNVDHVVVDFVGKRLGCVGRRHKPKECYYSVARHTGLSERRDVGYAPLRVILFEDEQGKGVLNMTSYPPSLANSAMRQVTKSRRYLDAAPQAVFWNAAGEA